MSESDNPTDGMPNNGSDENAGSDGGAEVVVEAQSASSDKGGSPPPSDGEHSFEKGVFKRCLYMFMFAVIGKITFFFILVLALVQLIFTLINKSPNEDMRRFTGNLSEYLRQIGRYLGFVTEEKPCPFNPFPHVGAD